jgi:stearoyl-CoA desaturase (Delta-9 desaturase)
MTRTQFRWFVLATAVLPPIGAVAAMALLWNQIFFWSDLAVLIFMYSLCVIGVTVGFHRLLAHRAFVTVRPVRIALTIAGTMAAQGQPVVWVSHHRRHHRFADRDGDPHSPHLDSADGVRGVLKGLWHAHMGWLFEDDLASEPMRYCPDLLREKEMRWMSQHFLLVVGAGVALPGLLGYLLSGTLVSALTGALWGGVVRIMLVNQVTYAVNSVGHFFGRRRFSTNDESHNVAWLALLSFGEGWHNNHHAFPRSFRHGLRWWEVDVGAWLIRGLESARLAWKVKRVNPDQLLRMDKPRSVRHTPA